MPDIFDNIVRLLTAPCQIQKGTRALLHVLKTKKSAIAAMHRPDIGDIDFHYGKYDYDDGKGHGLKKVVGSAKQKREFYGDNRTSKKLLLQVPEIIMRGVRSGGKKDRILLTYKHRRVVLDKMFNGKPSAHWIFHAYDIDPAKRRDSRSIAHELRKRKGTTRQKPAK